MMLSIFDILKLMSFRDNSELLIIFSIFSTNLSLVLFICLFNETTKGDPFRIYTYNV